MKKAIAILLMLLVCCAKENSSKDGAIKVNDTWIKKETIDRVTEMYRQQMMQQSPEKALSASSPEMRKNISKQLIANEVVSQEAKKRHFGYSEQKYQSTLAGIKRQFKDSATFAAELAQMGQTEEDMKRQIKEGLADDSLIKSLFVNRDSISSQECKAFYDANSARFSGDKKFRVSQILLKVERTATPDQKKAAFEKANALLGKLKTGADFAAFAKKNSEDPQTAVNGGDIGWFKRGDLMREFDVVATALKLNQISDVFESPAGFHIIKKTGEEALPAQTFEQVQPQISQMIKMKKQNDIVKTFVDSLIKVAKITYADTTLKMPLIEIAPQMAK